MLSQMFTPMTRFGLQASADDLSDGDVLVAALNAAKIVNYHLGVQEKPPFFDDEIHGHPLWWCNYGAVFANTVVHTNPVMIGKITAMFVQSSLILKTQAVTYSEPEWVKDTEVLTAWRDHLIQNNPSFYGSKWEEN